MRYLSRVLLLALLLAPNLWAASAPALDTLFAQGAFGEVQTRSEVAWRRAQGTGETLAAAVAAANVGAALTMLGQFEDAQLWQGRSAEILKTERVDRLLGRLAVAQAVTSFLQSRRYSTPPPVDALSHLKRAKKLLGPQDLRLRIVEAEVLGQSTDPDQAQAGYTAYLGLISESAQAGDSVAVGRYVSRLGRIDGDSGGHESALGQFVRAAAIFRTAGLDDEAALALRNAGHAHRKMEAYGEAETTLSAALVLAQEQNNKGFQAQIWNDLSRLYGETGQVEQAMRADGAADDLLAEIARAIPEGRAVDSVLLRFQHLLLLRFASLLPYEADLSLGFYDQLLLSARTAQ